MTSEIERKAFEIAERLMDRSVDSESAWLGFLAGAAWQRTQSAGVPEGWWLVPVEPTCEMTFAGQKHRYDSVWGIGAIYREMLAAAPAQPAAQNGTTSYRYRAELYDEVWQKARDMGYGNVTEALLALERSKVAAQDQGEVQRLREALSRIRQKATGAPQGSPLMRSELLDQVGDIASAALAASTVQEV